MQNQRGGQRVRTFLKAEIDMNGLSTLSCIIKDISDTGARLALSEGVTLPERFRLRLPKPDRWVRANVRWRRGDYVGVIFDVEAGGAAVEPQDGDAERIRQLEAEVTRLRRLLEEVRADPSRVQQLLDSVA